MATNTASADPNNPQSPAGETAGNAQGGASATRADNQQGSGENQPSYAELLARNETLVAENQSYRSGGDGGARMDAATPLPSTRPPAKAETDEKSGDGPATYTRAQLDAFVEEGRITQSQADAINDTQQQLSVKKVAQTAAQEYVQQAMHDNRVGGDIARYKQAIPEMSNSDSAAFKRVASEFAVLRDFGSPDSIMTELMALRSCFGALDLLEKANVNQEPQRDRQQDTAGGQGNGESAGNKDGNKGDPGQAPSNLTADENRYYTDLVGKGIYRDWNAVRKEMEFKGKHARKV